MVKNLGIKKRLVLLITILTAISVINSDILAYSSKTNQAPKVRQEQSLWCWAATSVSIMSWRGRTVSQTSFVTTVKGSAINVTATDSEVKHGLSQYRFSSTLTTSALSFSTVKDEIDRGRTIYAGITWYNSGRPTGGHAVEIIGYSDVPSYQYLTYMEPDDGTYKTLLYDTFKGSTSSTRHWDGSIYLIDRMPNS